MWIYYFDIALSELTLKPVFLWVDSVAQKWGWNHDRTQISQVCFALGRLLSAFVYHFLPVASHFAQKRLELVLVDAFSTQELKILHVNHCCQENQNAKQSC